MLSLALSCDCPFPTMQKHCGVMCSVYTVCHVCDMGASCVRAVRVLLCDVLLNLVILVVHGLFESAVLLNCVR